MRFQSRKALSTVVTSAMMLTFVAVLGTAMVAWSNSNLKGFETNLSNVTATNSNRLNENLIIQNVNFCKFCYSGNHGINVTLGNVGILQLQVTKIQINNGQTSWTLNPAATVLVGKYYTYNQSYSWTSQVPITVSATTARGSIITTQVTPP